VSQLRTSEAEPLQPLLGSIAADRASATLSADELLDQLIGTKKDERLRGTLKTVAVAFCYVITVASQVSHYLIDRSYVKWAMGAVFLLVR
jgi:hypothetical protein